MKLDFWKNNKLDQHYQIDDESLADQFRDWIQKQEDWKDLCNYYMGNQLLTRFISEELKSVWAHEDKNQEDMIHNIAYDVLWHEDTGLMRE